MFVGHFAVGLAAKRAAPHLSLGTTFIACQLLDLIWPVLVLSGVETVHVDPTATAFTPLVFDSYPWSHSLGMAALWSLLAYGLLRALRGSRLEAGAAAGLVLSHWVLDFASHRPDLPLWFGDGVKLGLGLWNSVAATVTVELALFAVGIGLYLAAAGSLRGRRPVIFWTLIGFLTVVYLANAFGPSPPADASPATIAGPALAMWLIVAWAYWADRPRSGGGLYRTARSRGDCER